MTHKRIVHFWLVATMITIVVIAAFNGKAANTIRKEIPDFNRAQIEYNIRMSTHD